VSRPVKLSVTKEMLQDALVEYTARRCGVDYPLQHSIEAHFVATSMGREDDALFTVTVEHVENVVVFPGTKR
jgi:hypothetical protein